MALPQDDFILLSVVNTKLRDAFSSFEDLCGYENLPAEEITRRLSAIGYAYDKESNAFKRV